MTEKTNFSQSRETRFDFLVKGRGLGEHGPLMAPSSDLDRQGPGRGDSMDRPSCIGT